MPSLIPSFLCCQTAPRGQDTSFRVAARQRWQHLRITTLTDAALGMSLDVLQNELGPGAAMRNYARWEKALHSPTFPDDASQWKYEVRGCLLGWSDAAGVACTRHVHGVCRAAV